MRLRIVPFVNRALLGYIAIIVAQIIIVSQTTNARQVQKRTSPKKPLSFSKFQYRQEQPEPARQGVLVRGVENYRGSFIDISPYNEVWKQELTNRINKEGGKSLITYSSKKRFVDNLRDSMKADECIRQLDLYGHGNPGRFMMGNSQGGDYKQSTFISINSTDPRHKPEWQDEFRLIKPLFCNKKSVVTLNGCLVGSDVAGAHLVFELSQILEVIVKAPVNYVRAPHDYDGLWQVADPSMKRPPPPKLSEEPLKVVTGTYDRISKKLEGKTWQGPVTANIKDARLFLIPRGYARGLIDDFEAHLKGKPSPLGRVIINYSYGLFVFSFEARKKVVLFEVYEYGPTTLDTVDKFIRKLGGIKDPAPNCSHVGNECVKCPNGKKICLRP